MRALLAVCLFSSCFAAPLLSGNSAFEGDYEDQRPLLAGVDDSFAFDGLLAPADNEVQIPETVPIALGKTVGHPMERHEIALLSHSVPVAGAPKRVNDDVVTSSIYDGREDMQPKSDDPLG